MCVGKQGCPLWPWRTRELGSIFRTDHLAQIRVCSLQIKDDQVIDLDSNL